MHFGAVEREKGEIEDDVGERARKSASEAIQKLSLGLLDTNRKRNLRLQLLQIWRTESGRASKARESE